MAQKTKHAEARKAFEQLDIGERISAAELANKVGATEYRDTVSVAAFLSNLAKRGRAKKHKGQDARTYYEKIARPAKPRTPRAAPPKERKKAEVTQGEIGESIVNYIEKLKERIEKSEKERDVLRTKVSMFSKQKEEFKRLYEKAEQKVKDLSEKQPIEQKTVRLPKITEDSS